MQFQFFIIPAHASEANIHELNQFLKQHRILSVQREFVADGANSYWAICVQWTNSDSLSSTSASKSRVDYREILSEQDFAVFAKLRTLRKEISDRESVPAYTLFTNEQLADMVRNRVLSATELGKISGVGTARVSKYGPSFIKLLKEAFATQETDSSLSEQEPH